MKKIIVSIVLLIALYFSARPFVLVTLDKGIAGVLTRSSVHYKFNPVIVWRW